VKKQKGQTAAEYALIIASIALFAFTAFQVFGCNTTIAVERVATELRES
jgi:Flp pilus assembly pilin Flp